jgi:hypothetical protein
LITSIQEFFTYERDRLAEFMAVYSSEYPTPAIYQWSLNPVYSNNVISNATSQTCTITFGTPGEYTLSVKGINTFGESPVYSKQIIVAPDLNTNPPLQLPYPNPVSNVLTVPLGQAARQQGAALSSALPEYDVRLYDEFGSIARQSVSTADKVELDVSGLPNGVYYLHIYVSGNTAPETHKVIIMH